MKRVMQKCHRARSCTASHVCRLRCAGVANMRAAAALLLIAGLPCSLAFVLGASHRLPVRIVTESTRGLTVLKAQDPEEEDDGEPDPDPLSEEELAWFANIEEEHGDETLIKKALSGIVDGTFEKSAKSDEAREALDVNAISEALSAIISEEDATSSKADGNGGRTEN